MWCGLIVGMVVTSFAPDADADRVIRKHEDNFAGVQSIRGTIEGRRSEDGGKTWRPMYEVKFLKNGQSERVHSRFHGSLFDGKWRGGITHLDEAYTPTETRSLSGLDPEASRPRIPLSGQDVSTIRGGIMAPRPASTEGRKVGWNRMLMINPDVRYSLRDLYVRSRNRTLKRGRSDDGASTWEFTLSSPDDAFSYVVTLSPDHGYLISGLTMRYADKTPGAEEVVEISSVQEYMTDASGLTLPKSSRSRRGPKGDEVFEVTLRDLEVNRPIADEDLALEFPAGAIVVNHVTQKYHVWGDGAPTTTFDTPQAFNDWNEKRLIALERRPARSALNATNLAILAAATIALIGLFAVRRKLRRAIGGSPA